MWVGQQSARFYGDPAGTIRGAQRETRARPVVACHPAGVALACRAKQNAVPRTPRSFRAPTARQMLSRTSGSNGHQKHRAAQLNWAGESQTPTGAEQPMPQVREA